MWSRDGERGWACVNPAHPVAGGCPAPLLGSAPAFAFTRPVFHFSSQKSKGCCPNLGSPLRGSGTAAPGSGQPAGHGRTRSCYSPVRPGPGGSGCPRTAPGWVPSRPSPAVSLDGAWPLGCGCLASGAAAGGVLQLLFVPTSYKETAGEKSCVKLNCIARFKLQIEIFLWSAHGFFFFFSPRGLLPGSSLGGCIRRDGKKQTHTFRGFLPLFASQRCLKGLLPTFLLCIQTDH